MGNDLREMQRYTIQNDRKIKKICAPLDCLGISIFTYISIDQEGRYVHLSNNAKFIHFFYAHEFYRKSPFVVHPHLLHPGYLFLPQAFDANYLKLLHTHVQAHYAFIILQHQGESHEGFYFGVTSEKSSSFVLLSHIELLHKFICYFKKEARFLIESMKAENFNAKKAKGEAFLQGAPSMPLFNNDPNIERFLKMVCPLSHREQQCLKLFKEGYSAQATGAILGLSQRTVESYFDNIKNKLGCHSKAELLNW